MSDEEGFDSLDTNMSIVKEVYDDVDNQRFVLRMRPELTVRQAMMDCIETLDRESISQPDEFVKAILPTISIAHAYIEELSYELILQEFPAEKHQENDLVKSEISDWSQGKKEDWLSQLDLIDGELKQKMEAVRVTRNNIIHDFSEHFEFSEIEHGAYELPEILEMTVECVDELQQKTGEDSPEFNLSG